LVFRFPKLPLWSLRVGILSFPELLLFTYVFWCSWH
jgi:hypothetical protein